MLLLHLGIPPSGHGYAPPIAVAIITVLAKKGCTVLKCICAFITPLPLLCQKTFRQWRKTVLASQSAQRRHDASPALPNFQRKRPPHSHWRNGSANWRNTFFFSFLRIQNSLSRNRLLQALPSDSSLLHSPRFPTYLFTKRKGRKSVLNIRGWTPSLLFPVELVMFLTMFPFIKEIRLFVPAHGAVNQTGDVFF